MPATAQQIVNQLTAIQSELSELKETLQTHHAESIRNETWTTAATIKKDYKIDRHQLEDLVAQNKVKKTYLHDDNAERMVRYSLTSLTNHITNHSTLTDGLNGKLAKSILESILEDKKERTLGKNATPAHGCYWDTKKKKFITFDNRDHHIQVQAFDTMPEAHTWLTTTQQTAEELFTD